MKPRYQWQLESVRAFLESCEPDDRAEILALFRYLNDHLNELLSSLPDQAVVEGRSIKIFPARPGKWGCVFVFHGATIEILDIFEAGGTDSQSQAVERAVRVVSGRLATVSDALPSEQSTYIRRIDIHNVRGFHDDDRTVSLDLRRPDGSLAGWTVLAGSNGAGKTTVLQAIALAYYGVHLQDHWNGWLHHHHPRGEVSIDIETRSKLLGTYKTLLKRDHEQTTASHQPNKQMKCLIIGYGPFRRISRHSYDAQRLMFDERSSSRFVTLFREDASLAEGVQWLREVYLQELEGQPSAKYLVDNALLLLQDGLLPEGMNVNKIDSHGLWVTQHDQTVALSQLSEGCKSVTALVLDIVRHMYRAFGEFRLEADRVVPYAGVVLIDEVEAHLHILWQQRLGFWFKAHFPNVQFIVTTHSPFICQAADRNGIIRLPAPGEARSAEHVSEETYYQVVNGTADHATITELFSLESPYSQPAETLRQRVAELEFQVLRDTITPEGHDELDELAAQLPKTGSAAVERALRKLAVDDA